jgi:hypothetical protein
MVSALYILGTVLFIAVAMEVHGRLVRAVYRDIPLTNLLGMFDWYIATRLRTGANGMRIVMYDRSSGIMVQVTKSLDPEPSWPQYRSDGKVKLRLLKTLPRRPRKEGPIFPRGPFNRGMMWGADRVNPCVPYWRLPSPYAGEVLAEVECGASLSRLREALREAFLKDPVLSACASVDLWFERSRAGWRTLGIFEDEESTAESGKGLSSDPTQKSGTQYHLFLRFFFDCAGVSGRMVPWHEWLAWFCRASPTTWSSGA